MISIVLAHTNTKAVEKNRRRSGEAFSEFFIV